ncbi:MAG: tetratricopeptide repeat protein [Tannerellaceae bacterium]|jgi:tetratricopeptide (TPR) repeat protein|nr:tetratricopeptide repeat protein [Tannerellaceae bacterium]
MPTWGQESNWKSKRKFDYFFYEGLKLKNAAKYDAAFDMFAHCAAIDSTSAPLLYEMASFYLMQGQNEKAVDMLKQSVKYSADNFTYKMALATTAYKMELLPEAIETYKDLIEHYPDKTELIYYFADALTRSGENSRAVAAYNLLESITGMNEEISMQKYKLYNMQEKPDSALLEIEKLAAKFPTDARYPIIIGDLYLEEGNVGKAYEFYQKAHTVDADNPYYIVSMANYYEAINEKDSAETQIRTALANETLDVETKVSIVSRYIISLERLQKDSDKAIELFDMLINQHPEAIELKLMYGRLLLVKDKNEEAKFQFQLVSEMAPDNAAAWQSLLDMALKAQNMDEVIRLCKKCIELFPDAPEYYFYLSIGYYQANDYDNADDACNRGLKVVPDDNRGLKSTLYGQKGDILHQAGKDEEAFQAYDAALSFNDKNIIVLNNYAYFLSLLKRDLQKAERMSSQCIKLEPDNATYLDTYAWIFFMQGNYMLAKIYIENALSKDKTNSSELVDHYGDILYMTGDKENALIQWQKAKELGKDTETLNLKITEKKYIEDENAK